MKRFQYPVLLTPAEEGGFSGHVPRFAAADHPG